MFQSESENLIVGSSVWRDIAAPNVSPLPEPLGQLAALLVVNALLERESGSDSLVEELLKPRVCVAVVPGEQRFANQFAKRKRACRALSLHRALDFRRYPDVYHPSLHYPLLFCWGANFVSS